MTEVRKLAHQILLQLDRRASYPDRLIRSMLERHQVDDPRDRAFLTELVYGVLRWQGRLDWHIDQLSRVRPGKISPPVRILLRLALYQMFFLDRVPSHAAVNEAVKMARATQRGHVAGFVNGLLRQAGRLHPDWDWPPRERNFREHLAVTTSHPPWLVGRLLQELGPEETEALCQADNEIAPTTLRVNPLKTDTRSVLGWLTEHGMEGETSPYLDEALRIRSFRRDITQTPPYRSGWIQIQDEASQLIAHLASPRPGGHALDLCAGFGGKSTHLGILMENRGKVVAVDEASWKLEQLMENARRQDLSIVRTEAADVLELSENLGLFDCVLLDAPCTGLGTLRRNPDIRWRRHPKDPYRFSQLQERLLDRAARFVARGGVLVYATCSVLREENEDVARRFLQGHPEFHMEPASDFLPKPCRSMVKDGFFRSWPHKHGIDGFFAARWRRSPE